ncbi:MAG: Shedu anti-phage system protein SduA domain-containing protein [Intestinibacter bartlettii]|uniref:Shedu anti-phage system protein SduA domain-containing protein n=2 Tax=Intestinibacter bartlettii TaxID=261299 RepID=UPI00241FDAFC|nr:hypothetical protein [Intestinibacter bartlettii]
MVDESIMYSGGFFMLQNGLKIPNYEIRAIYNITKRFSDDFINEVRGLIHILDKLKIKEVKSGLPNLFQDDKEIATTCYFTFDKKQMYILFNQNKNKSFNFIPTCGNPIPNIYIDSSNFGIISLQNTFLGDGKNGLMIELGFIINSARLSDILENIKEFAIDFLNSNRDLYKYKDKYDRQEYLKYLGKLKGECKVYFLNENTPELVIDKFLERNPVILERGLHLEKLNHQLTLKNILNKYEHDLKPDLIAFDTLNKKWVVVDYKKAKRKIIKNLHKVRTGFKSEVGDLKNQLNDYLEYFEEEDQRNYVKKTYKIDIKYPDGIGIIGQIDSEEKEAFNRLMKNEPRWFRVMPYNYLYDSFCKYVEMITTM